MESQESTQPHRDSQVYDGTRGYSAPGASQDAAEAERDKGITNEIQRKVVELADERGHDGITVAEARVALGEHHGRVSSALTKMHIAGKLVALEERRGNAGVYVTPEHVGDREVRPYRRQKKEVTTYEIHVVLLKHSRIDGAYVSCACGWLPTREQPSHAFHVADQIHALIA